MTIFWAYVKIERMILTGEFLLNSLPRERLVEAIENNPSLRGYLQGYIAEEKLKDFLSQIDGVHNVYKIPDRDPRKGDFAFSYGGVERTVELKSVRSGSSREDILIGGVNCVVSVKNTDSLDIDGTGVKVTNLRRGDFDILAISLVSISGEWDFRFIANKHLPSSSKMGDDYIRTVLTMNTDNTPFLRTSILEVIKDIS